MKITTYKLLVDSFDNDSAKKNHGTLVLGVLGAINNNSNGIVSTGGDVSDIYISADPRGKAMLKVSALADSFNCKVINCSWTGENDNEYVEKLYRNVCDKNDCVVKSASITITDISNTIRQNYPINQANGTLTISVDNMPKGVYYVTLNVEGAVADTKSLIVQ